MEALFPFDGELSQRLALPVESPTSYTDPNNNSNKRDSGASDSNKHADKYSLRPRSRTRAQTKSRGGGGGGGGEGGGGGGPKPKQKPAPLSKYRRKTANARERSRMREINQAFETLRQAVPSGVYLCGAASPSSVGGGGNVSSTNQEKLTKITTLRLAMKYISTLSAALSSRQNEFERRATSSGDSSSSTTGSDLDSCCLLFESSDGESLNFRSDDLSVEDDQSLPAVDFSLDFPGAEDSLDFPPLSPGDFTGHLVTAFDPFLSEIS